MIKYLIFLTVFNPILTFGQYSLKVKDIDIIGIKNTRLDFYTFKDKNSYKIYLNKVQDNEFEKLIVDSDYYPIQSTIISKNKDIVKKQDILKFDFDKSFENTKYEIITGNGKWLFSKFNKFFVMIEYYKYEEYYDPNSEKRVIGWKIENINYYPIYYIDIGNGKKILAVADRDGYIIPTKDKLIIQINDIDFTDAKLIKNSIDNLSFNLIYFHTKDYYFVHMEPNKKITLRGKYGEQVIQLLCDSIFLNDRFIICIIENKYHIFNARLDKLGDNNIRSVYPYRSRLQLIQGNKMKIIDVMNQDAESKYENYYVCGDVGFYKYTISKDSITIAIDKNFTEGTNSINKYSLGNLKVDSTYFLNNSCQLSYNDNDVTYNSIPYNWLLVLKKGKFGLIEFKTSNKGIHFKEILPIAYDSIEAYGYQHPLKLKINGLYTYYRINNCKYKKLEKFNKNYCRFIDKNGQKGWLDLKGNEYLDK